MARTMRDIPAERLAELNSGKAPIANLVEGLAIDFSILVRNVAPDFSPEGVGEMEKASELGIVKRMRRAAELLMEEFGPEYAEVLAVHTSDTVRGWACFIVALQRNLSLGERLSVIRRFADDAHYNVREWAWLALRPHIIAELDDAVRSLRPWTAEPSEYLRRFACESTRPRGVWSAHIPCLKQRPEIGLEILEPLRSDPSRYVQDSVSNWLNDAAKSRPEWVESLCTRWSEESRTPETKRICSRARRSLRTGKK